MRELARALGTAVVSSSRIHDAFTKPRLPTWGLVQMLVVELASRTPGADAAAEVKRLHTLWDEAAQADLTDTGIEPLPPQAVSSSHSPTAGALRSILLLELEGFHRRDDVEQAYKRRMLTSLLDSVARTAGITPAARLQADRGDSVIELIDAAFPVATLLRTLLSDMPAQLNAVNRLASGAARLRLKLVLASGRVVVGKHDAWMGTDLNDACRLLDADVLRMVMREGKSNYALGLSEGVYQGAVRHNRVGIPAQDFRPVAVPTKDGVRQMWLHQPFPNTSSDLSPSY
ncbi:hypothetical protein ACFWFZ_27220 [Streptomyces sp. NPDC060232]|uniref:hypothetical protein n=1 Tax=Streptomyces sp. NPDC060232 TaxID=3347079 RepID=UPI00365F6BC0